MKDEKISVKVIKWLVVLVLVALGIAGLIVKMNAGTPLLFLAALMIMPVKFNRELWGEDKSGRPVKMIILLFLIVYGFICTASAHALKARTNEFNELIENYETLIQEYEERLENIHQEYTEQTDLPEHDTEPSISETDSPDDLPAAVPGFNMDMVPPNDGRLYFEINGNVPFFTEDDYTVEAFEKYSPLDRLGRCGTAYACIGTETMPTEPRGKIGMIKPSGWQITKYDFIDGQYLYNRSHLIAHQLSGENANEKNLITGTRYMNAQCMEPFESLTGDYVRSTKNHVLYRVTPVFEGDDLLASGVLMEAYSVEDNGAGICFCIFCYNAQPGVVIDYSDGTSRLAGENETVQTTVPTTSIVLSDTQENAAVSGSDCTYILNVKTGKFHFEWCTSVEQIKDKNKEKFITTREQMIAQGYKPCGECCP